MAKLCMTVSHRLTQEEALRRIKTLLAEVKDQYADQISNLHELWNGEVGTFSFSAMGFSISGTLTVGPTTVELIGNLPFAALMFKGKIENVIRERAEALLAAPPYVGNGLTVRVPARSPDLLPPSDPPMLYPPADTYGGRFSGSHDVSAVFPPDDSIPPPREPPRTPDWDARFDDEDEAPTAHPPPPAMPAEARAPTPPREETETRTSAQRPVLLVGLAVLLIAAIGVLIYLANSSAGEQKPATVATVAAATTSVQAPATKYVLALVPMYECHTPCSVAIDYKFELDTQGDPIDLKFPGVEQPVKYSGKGTIVVPSSRDTGDVSITSPDPDKKVWVRIWKVAPIAQ